MPRHPSAVVATVLAAALCAASAHAQMPAVRALPLLGSEADDFGRLAVLVGSDSARPQSLRSPSRLWNRDPARAFSAAIVAPELYVGHNSALPHGFNDGPLWQGRGTNLRLTAGVAAQYAGLRVILAPQLVHAANLSYQVIPYFDRGATTRSVWANPFHPAPAGIDLPLRHGDSPVRRLDPGQSSVTVTARGVEAGVATESVWWGPGMQNALLLGAHAPGVPSAFIRAARPVSTRLGTWDGWWMVGQLRESEYFDADDANDVRTVAGIAATWRPPRATGLELGLARLVIATGSPDGSALFYPFQSVGRPNGPDSLGGGTRDQITTVWARWAQPGTGFEAWAELARFEEPASVRDLLEYPGHSQGYTLGLQWTRPVAASRVRIWAEGTYLEPSPSIRVRHVEATYVSRSVPQGFTNRGQSLGAAIGPGSSSQWVSGDWIHDRWRVGGFLSRVRWDNAALFTPVVPEVRREDVSLTGGLRAAGEWQGMRMLAEWARTVRLNYLFQAYLVEPATGRTEGIDIVNNAVTLTVSAPLGFTK